ncbi:MAG: HEAT repeat domain-containing protein [Gemmatimonadales bacterium]
MRCIMLLALSAGMTASLAAQSLESRVGGVKDGAVRFEFAARPGVCGDGDHSISYHDGNNQGEWEGRCAGGPVRVVVTRAAGRTTALRTYVGGRWRRTATLDLGTVGAAEASRWLIALAERNEPAADDAILPATLADSVVTWPSLLRIARNDGIRREARKSAVFWLGQAAGDAATRGLDSLVGDESADREIRESAVFALSQRPEGEGVPVLVRLARSDRDPEIRRKAIFWLGQSEAPAALALFEELLTKP